MMRRLQFLPDGISLWFLIVGIGVQFAAVDSLRAQEIPSNMIVVGQISAMRPEAVVPRIGDWVRAVDMTSGAELGAGKVVDGDGTYVIELSRVAGDNGRAFTLVLSADQGSYQLTSGPNKVSLVYSGGLFPSRLSVNVTIGSRISGNQMLVPDAADPKPEGPDARLPLALARYAVLGRPVFDESDIEAIKGAVARGIQSGSYDVNGDGIVNTRDIIDAIRALAGHRRASQVRFRDPAPYLDLEAR